MKKKKKKNKRRGGCSSGIPWVGQASVGFCASQGTRAGPLILASPQAPSLPAHPSTRQHKRPSGSLPGPAPSTSAVGVKTRLQPSEERRAGMGRSGALADKIAAAPPAFCAHRAPQACSPGGTGPRALGTHRDTEPDEASRQARRRLGSKPTETTLKPRRRSSLRARTTTGAARVTRVAPASPLCERQALCIENHAVPWLRPASPTALGLATTNGLATPEDTVRLRVLLHGWPFFCCFFVVFLFFTRFFPTGEGAER